MEWRDIDPPPEGPVIIYVPGRGVIMARFSRYWNRWLHWPYSDYKIILEPTKWMHRPSAPPAEKEK